MQKIVYAINAGFQKMQGKILMVKISRYLKMRHGRVPYTLTAIPANAGLVL